MKKVKAKTVCIGIFAVEGTLIGKARAVLEPRGSDVHDRIELEFSHAIGGYTSREVSPGPYVLVVSAEGLETQRRSVEVDADGLSETVVLGRPGMRYYYRGSTKVAFDPLPFLAVSFSGPASSADRSATAIAERYKAEIVDVGNVVYDERVRVFRIPGAAALSRQAEILRELPTEEGVRFAGPVVSLRKNSVAFLTNESVVKFEPSVQPDEVAALASTLKLTVVRPIPYARNAYLLQAADAWSGLAACDALVESGQVVYAEPNLVATALDDQVHPTDFLAAQQWHLPLVNLPYAWAALQVLNGPGVVAGGAGDLTFGSEKITIAVLDRGIPSKTIAGVVQPVHQEFNGQVTGGAAKISRYFDFSAMSPDNDATTDSHGVKCAGIAAALANNASTVGNESEGIAGAAPNCRVMAIIRDVGGSELQYADAYIWMAGFDPLSPQPGFPAPLPAGSAADLISNSFGLTGSMGAPISGLMADCFDYLTTNGRGGKGVVLCFSVGNDLIDFRLDRPWAAYPKTIAVAASTQLDKKSPFGGFGCGIDVCAPAGDGTVNVTTCHLPGKGTLVGHTGGTKDYTPFFSGTSASAPLVAGIAALMLSARPDLTWAEVRKILCRTAVRIDLGNTDAVGQWIDSDQDGQLDYSKWYGFGRVDALCAVVAAIAEGQASLSTAAPAAPAGLQIVS